MHRPSMAKFACKLSTFNLFFYNPWRVTPALLQLATKSEDSGPFLAGGSRHARAQSTVITRSEAAGFAGKLFEQVRRIKFASQTQPLVARNIFRHEQFSHLQKCLSSTSTANAAGETASAATKPLIVTETVGGVRMIGLNRPEKKNAINAALAQALRDALTAMEEDESIRAGVLYGEGGTFCSGYDLSEASNIGMDELRKRFKEEEGLLGPTRSLMCKKPLVAGISGYAVAGGFELALFCDMRIADENAIMGVLNRRFGVPLIDGGTVRLPKLVGLSRALDIILTGRQITAKEGRDIGLLYNICSPGCAVGQAYQLAQMLCKFPPKALLGDRLSAYSSAYNCKGGDEDSIEEEEFQRAIRYEQKVGYRAAAEALEGATAFAHFGMGKHGKNNFDYEKIVQEVKKQQETITAKKD